MLPEAQEIKLLFALSSALLDASISAWDTKYTYTSVRPITAITKAVYNGTTVRRAHELTGPPGGALCTCPVLMSLVACNCLERCLEPTSLAESASEHNNPGLCSHWPHTDARCGQKATLLMLVGHACMRADCGLQARHTPVRDPHL